MREARKQARYSRAADALRKNSRTRLDYESFRRKDDPSADRLASRIDKKDDKAMQKLSRAEDEASSQSQREVSRAYR